MSNCPALLMGGQACVLYGAAEFSRDIDLVIVAKHSLELENTLAELQAKPIAVPPFSIDYLERGHAVHFRCSHPEALGMRVVLMSKLRGVEDFEKLWERRTTFQITENTACDVLSLPDLVKAKKTQRDKDWPMIRRLVDVNYFQFRNDATPTRVAFWLEELRSADALIELVTTLSITNHPREAVFSAIHGDKASVESALKLEEERERAADREYWRPLKAELEQTRKRAHRV